LNKLSSVTATEWALKVQLNLQLPDKAHK